MIKSARELATISSSQLGDEHSECLTLGQVANEVNVCLRHGREPDIEELTTRHPELATQIRELVPALVALHEIGHGDEQESVPSAPVPPLTESGVAGRLGDYRIVREIGRGGMGVVYEAEQISLGRRVALKVLPFAAVLDPRRLQRFKNEAHAAGQLHHQHIVPVYSVGLERGVHYFAMQYIEGQSLADVIDQLRRHADLEKRLGDHPRQPHESESEVVAAGAPESPRSLTAAALDAASAPPSGQFGPAERGPTAPGPTGAFDEPSAGHDRREPTALNAADTKDHAAAGLSTARSFRSRAYFRTVAKAAVQAAEALEHAHGIGVLHRDVKPSNLLLDTHGNLWITDFGLARMEGEAGLTMSGDLLGTLRYMSPEQSLAKRIPVDHRTDIYSLGVTLYELLTLRPAVEGQDRQEILRRIAFEEPRPPRRLNGAIPSELETIVLKAMAKNPAERYASAQELADDLNRFLEDRPILAKRPNVLQRLGKWTRRHKIMVRSATVTLLAALVLGTGLVWRERAEAIRQRNAAEENYQRARAAVDRFFTHVSESPKLKAFGLEPLRQELLKEARDFYEQFLRDPRSDKEVQTEHGRTIVRLALISSELGDKHEAANLGRQALEIFESLARSHPDVASHQWHRATTHASLAVVYFDIGRTELAAKHHSSALADLEPLAARHQDTLEYRHALARSLTDLASLHDHTGRSELAEAGYERSLAVLELLARADGDADEYQLDLAKTHEQLGELFAKLGRTAEAEKTLLRAVAILESKAPSHPDGSEFQFVLAQCQMNLGTLYWPMGRVADAEAANRSALGILEVIGRVHPDLPEIRSVQSVCQTNLATLYHFMLDDAQRGKQTSELALATLESLTRTHAIWPEDQFALSNYHQSTGLAFLIADRAAEAEQAFQNALPMLQTLADDHPDTPKYRHALGAARLNLGNAYQAMARFQDAQTAYQTALGVMQTLVDAHPQIPGHRKDLATCHNNLGVLLLQIGDYEKAESAHETALQLREELTRKHPEIAEYQRDLAQSHGNLAELYRRTGRTEPAERILSSELSVLERLAANYKEVPSYQASLAQRFATQGNTYFAAGQWQRAEAAYRKAIDIRKTLVLAYPNRREYENALGIVLHNLGWLYASTQRTAEAEETFQESLKLKQKLADADPERAAYQHSLAQTLNTLGSTYANLRRTAEAESTYQRALGIRETLAGKNADMIENTIDRGGTLCNLGHLFRDTARYEPALESYRNAIESLQVALARQPLHSDSRLYLRNAHRGRAEVLGLLGQHEQAIDDWDRTIELDIGPSLPWFRLQRSLTLARLDRHAEAIEAANALPEHMREHTSTIYTLACVFARASDAVRRDERLSRSDRDQFSEQHAARAIELLQQAHAAGHFRASATAEKVNTDRDLDPLRPRQDFQNLLAKLRGE